MATSLIRQFQQSDVCQNFPVQFQTYTHLKELAHPVSTALCQDTTHGENTFYELHVRRPVVPVLRQCLGQGRR